MAEFRTADTQAVAVDGLFKGKLLGRASISCNLPTSTVFADGTTNGYSAAAFAWRFNDDITNQPLAFLVALPDDFNGASDVLVRVRTKLSGSTDVAVTVTLAARVDGGSDLAPTNATVLTTTTQDILFTIPAGSIADTAKSLFLSVNYSAGLVTDDALLYSVSVEHSRETS